MNSEQFLFDFDSAPKEKAADPIADWRGRRSKEVAELCQRLGLPIGHEVEVELSSGPVLCGILQLAEELLWNDVSRKAVRLEVDGLKFGLGEVASVVRR